MANPYLIRFFGDNLIAAMQNGDRVQAYYWQVKMYAGIKVRNQNIWGLNG